MDKFRNLLLSKVGWLVMRVWAWNQLEEGLLLLLSNVEVTSARLLMLSYLSNPNEFGGHFFLDSEGNHTVFTELIESKAFPSQNTLLSIGTVDQCKSALQISKSLYIIW